MAMVEISDDRGNQRLHELRLGYTAEEAEADAADVLVGVLEVISEVLNHEDHLREHPADGVGLV